MATLYFSSPLFPIFWEFYKPLTTESRGREERRESKESEGEKLTFDELNLPGVSTVIASVSFLPFNHSEVYGIKSIL